MNMLNYSYNMQIASTHDSYQWAKVEHNMI